MSITVIVRETSGGSYEARHNGELLATSATPFCSAARVLLAQGHKPGTRYAMRREGLDSDALVSALGIAARLTVSKSEESYDHEHRPTDLAS